MKRALIHYDRRTEGTLPFAGIDVSTPVAGFFRYRMRAASPRGGVRIWYGPPKDPVTGEVLDRSWRWQAEFNGELVDDFDRVWPACAGDPITEADYRAYCARTEWARQNAPNSSYATGKRRDPLSVHEPLPF